MQDLESGYETLFAWLVEHHVDFDYGDEEMLGRLGGVGMDANGFYLSLGSARYHSVVVPRMTTIRSSTIKWLTEFQRKGGVIVFPSDPPRYIDAAPSTAAVELSHGATRVPWDGDALVAALTRARPNPVEIKDADGKDAGQIFYQLRNDSPRQILAVMSMDRQNWIRGVRLRIKGAGFVTEWDCRTAERFRIPATSEDGSLSWTSDFPPLGERLFVITHEPAQVPTKPSYTEVASQPVHGPFAYTLSELNVLVLDLAQYRVGDSAWMPESEVLKIDEAVRHQLGLPLRAGNEIQPWFERKHFPLPKAVGRLQMRFQFEIQQMPASPVQLAMEQPANFKVLLNGKPVESNPNSGWWIDPAIRTLALQPQLIKPGTNTVELSTDFRADVDIESLYLIGAFGVRLNGTSKIITALPPTLEPTDLVNQGLPFYSGVVTYHIPIPKQTKTMERVVVKTPQFEAACIKAGTGNSPKQMIAWQPYQAEIPEEALHRGELDLQVTLTRRNTFGPLHLTPKKAVAYGPDSFRSQGPAWSQTYQLYPSGLLSNPVMAAYKLDAK